MYDVFKLYKAYKLFVPLSMLSSHCCCCLSPAPPLTVDNVLNVVKNVRSWRTLGQCIYSSSIAPYYLDAIQRQHVSDEACLKAVIDEYLSGKGRYKQPSWRAVIWSLYRENEIQLAEHIRTYAEPVQGNCYLILMPRVWHMTHHTRAHASWVWLQLSAFPCLSVHIFL